jgi:hypothetical protein
MGVIITYCFNPSHKFSLKALRALAASNGFRSGLVPLFDLKFLKELAATAVGTSNRRH